MSVLPFAGDLQGFEFSSVSKLDFSDRTRVEAYINRYFTLLGKDAVLVMLMHSWSFLYLNGDTGYFEDKGTGLASRFDRFLSDLPPDLEVITAADAARLIGDGQLTPERVRNVELAAGDVQNAQKMDFQAVVDFVSASLAPGSTVAVISKGDEKLIKLDGCRGWHFPQTNDGVYAGYHPEDSRAVIAHLEDLRSRGAEFLLVPKPSFWWLDYYAEFRHHLNTHYKVIAFKEAAGVLFDLCPDSRGDVLKSLYVCSDGGR